MILTRKAHARQEESKLNLALSELKASKELCDQLLRERDDNESEFLVILDQNKKLKREMALLNIQHTEAIEARDRLQFVVDEFKQCSDEYETTLNDKALLKQQLHEANSQISELETLNLNITAGLNNSLFSELVSAHASQLQYNDLLKQLSLYSSKLTQSARRYETDTQSLQSELDQLTSKLEIMSNKYSASERQMREYMLAMNELERFLRGCGSPSLSGEDVHVLCGCIKDFLRSLREPLVTSALWADFMEAAKLAEPSDATAAIVQAVSQLPQPNRDTLAFLVLHLQKVAESPDCEMGIDNLAKIFGPTLIGYGLMSQPTEMYNATAQMFNVMQLLLRLPCDYWSQWACPNNEAASPHAGTLPRPRGFFFSPADTGVSRKKRNYFQ
ncbi:unnamed protein product [Spodoptera exigua]|nr:unnamed protein product [Spodoptera exigua]